MTRKIVVGVDGSETAAAAARTAASLARGLGAELHVLSAFGQAETERLAAEGVEVVISHRQRADEAVDKIDSQLRREFPDVVITRMVAEGKPATALVNAAERTGADLIVVGNKRVQGIARVLGSIAADVARRSPCDVYIAHTRQR